MPIQTVEELIKDLSTRFDGKLDMPVYISDGTISPEEVNETDPDDLYGRIEKSEAHFHLETTPEQQEILVIEALWPDLTEENPE